MGTKLFIGNIAFTVTDSMLEEAFAKHGTVTSAQIITDKDTGRSKGFGFVEMSSESEAQASIAAVNGTEMNGRALSVAEARPQSNRQGGRGGSGGRGFSNNRY
jgi:cold-inducible RNA-binding protein